MPDAEVKALRKHLRNLTTTKRNMQKKILRLCIVPPHIKAVCLLLMILGAPPSLAQLFYLNWIAYFRPALVQKQEMFQPENWNRWLEENAVTELLWRALQDVLCPLRVRVETLMIEAHTASQIHAQNCKGVLVPFADVFAWFYAACVRSCSWPRIRAQLARKVNDPEAAKTWARHFRERWQLKCVSLPQAKALGKD